jgi:hypothetical protein
MRKRSVIDEGKWESRRDRGGFGKAKDERFKMKRRRGKEGEGSCQKAGWLPWEGTEIGEKTNGWGIVERMTGVHRMDLDRCRQQERIQSASTIEIDTVFS